MKLTRILYQQDLIEPAPAVERTLLQAEDSPRQAFYEIAIYELSGGAGFYVQKLSGAKGAKPTVETWWRPNLVAAQEKKALLIAGKLGKKKGRIYSEVQGELPACKGL